MPPKDKDKDKKDKKEKKHKGMITIKDNGPVKFLEDGETPFDEIQSSDCNCTGQEFCQIVHSGDTTPFQVELSDTGLDIVSNGTFSSDTVWTKGTGWTITGGKAVHASGFADVIQQQIAVTKSSTYYKITFTVSEYSSSQNLNITFAGDVIKTVNANGTYTVYWFTDAVLSANYIIFQPDINTSFKLDNVEVKEMTTITYGIKDLDDEVIVLIANGAGVTYFENIASIEVDWSGVADGCYRIFLAENGSNLFTNGDDGTFEDTSDAAGSPPSDWGLTIGSLGDLLKSANYAHSGDFSIEATTLSAFAVGTHTLWTSVTNITVNPNSLYVIEGYILKDSPNTQYNGSDVEIQAVGITSLLKDSYTITSTNGAWNYVSTVFNSGANTNITIKAVINILSQVTTQDMVLYFDDITVRGPVTIESECFKKGSFECTKLLSWNNNENAYGFIYDGTTFQHELRVKSKLWKPKYPKDKKEVFVDSAGNRRILTSRTKKEEELSLEEIPTYLHDALSIGVEHDNFYIDGVKYINEETDYDPAWRNSSLLAPVVVTVTKDSQDLSNSYC